MTPGPEDNVSQAEKRQIIREQATTMHQHAQAQAGELSGGRFAATGTPNVTGTTPIPSYPAASASWQIQLPDEPPLGFDNPALKDPADVSSSSSAEPGGAESAPPAPPGVQHPAPPSSPFTAERSK